SSRRKMHEMATDVWRPAPGGRCQWMERMIGGGGERVLTGDGGSRWLLPRDRWDWHGGEGPGADYPSRQEHFPPSYFSLKRGINLSSEISMVCRTPFCQRGYYASVSLGRIYLCGGCLKSDSSWAVRYS